MTGPSLARNDGSKRERWPGGVLLTGLRSPAVFLPLAADPPTIAGTNRYRLGTIRMQISAERRVAARREAVWAALNDLDTLQDCIRAA